MNLELKLKKQEWNRQTLSFVDLFSYEQQIPIEEEENEIKK